MANFTLLAILCLLVNFACRSDTLEGCDSRMDLVFILDSSESVLDSDPINQPGHTWAAIKNFTWGVVRHLPVGQDTLVAAIRFGSQAEVVFHLQEHGDRITTGDAIMSMTHHGGNTNIAAALRLARSQTFSGDFGARGDARNVVVFIGDGIDNMETHSTIEEIGYLKDFSRAEIFTVGVSEQVAVSALENMATLPVDKHFIHAPALEDLDFARNLLAHRICQLPDPVTTTPRPAECHLPGCKVCPDMRSCVTCRDGNYLVRTHCEECIPNCRVCHDASSCDQCMTGWYWEPNLHKCEECEVIADLVLVIDNSGSIRDKNPEDNSYDNYEILKDFLNRLLDRLHIGPNATRVGAIKFSSKAQLVFTLGQYEQRPMIQQALSEMQFGGGHTNISGGLRMAREMFEDGLAGGNRPGVGDIALIITDGESTKDKNLTLPEAELAKEAAITLFVVGVTDEINELELKTIASPPIDDHYFNSTDIRHLDDLLDGLIKQVCMPKVSAMSRGDGL